MHKIARIVILAAALVFPAAIAAQEAASSLTPAAQAEIAQIQQRVVQLQLQASQDSAVMAQEEAFSRYLMSVMEGLDATAKEKGARAEALKAEVEAAHAASDNAKLNALAAEATELQAFFNGLRQRALARPDVQERRKAYITALFARMNAIDPQAQALIDRLQEVRSGAMRP